MNIVFLDGYTLQTSNDATMLKRLEAYGNLTVYDRTSNDEIVERAKDAEILIVNKTSLTAEVINQLPKLQLICEAATGYDKIDIVAARKCGIPICNCVGYSSTVVAQMALSLLLEAADNVGYYTYENLKGRWSDCEDFCYSSRPRFDLANKRMAIVGFGNIGRTIANVVRPLGVKLFAVSSKSSHELPNDVTKLELKEAFGTCDIVSLNCPLNDSNRGFVNAELLQHARKGLILINTARGGLINESDVAEALKNGKLGAYCTDVLCQEPPSSDCPILHAPNAYITPHIGWKTSMTVERIIDIVCDNIAAFLKGEPKSVVN